MEWSAPKHPLYIFWNIFVSTIRYLRFVQKAIVFGAISNSSFLSFLLFTTAAAVAEEEGGKNVMHVDGF